MCDRVALRVSMRVSLDSDEEAWLGRVRLVGQRTASGTTGSGWALSSTRRASFTAQRIPHGMRLFGCENRHGVYVREQHIPHKEGDEVDDEPAETVHKD